MKKIELNEQDYEFLKELQHELNTQETDGNAQPVFWGVEEEVEDFRGTDGDYGGEPYIRFDDGKWSVEEAVQEVEEVLHEYEPDIQSEWTDVDKESADDIYEFMTERLKWDNVYDVIYIDKKWRVTPYTGAFITKRACKNYIERYGYNHCKPHTYAMTAYRNFELERLLKILREMKMDE